MDVYRNMVSRCVKGGPPVIHLFGGPYVTLGGQRRDVPEGSKRLLALVALRRKRVERRHAAGTLWPFGDDNRAAGNLRSALWRLRGAGIDLLSTDKWSLTLSDGVVVDAHLVAEWAGRLIDGTDCDEDLAVSPAWIDALDLLPGWYDDWALIERERLRQRTLHALEALSRKLVGIGRYADAVDAAMLAVSAEPLRESAQLVLMQAHVAEGNLVEARRGCQLYRDLLHRELGIEPSTELLMLLHQTKQGRTGQLAAPQRNPEYVTA
jgi:DNA-binding SARP family transcriptional activator